MRTVVLGKKIENVYTISTNNKVVNGKNGGSELIYTDKPKLNKLVEIVGWVEICSFEGEPHYNSGTIRSFYENINISEDETVDVTEKVFRADLNELHLRTNKIVEETDCGKEEITADFAERLKDFNTAMIESNEKLKTYCDVHKLDYGETDAIELFGIVFPGKKYKIEDGAMGVEETTASPITYNPNKNNIKFGLLSLQEIRRLGSDEI